MISPGSQLWEAVRRRSNSSTVDDAVDSKVISYRSLFERAQAKRREQAGGGLDAPVVLCENSALERAAAILAAAADGLPFFIVETGAISEEEGKTLLPLPKTSGDAGTTPDPNTVIPLQTDTLDPPFFFMLEPCQSPPLCARAVGRQTAGEGLKSRIGRLSITEESRVLSLLDPISPGYPYVVCSSLLAGAQWIDVAKVEEPEKQE